MNLRKLTDVLAFNNPYSHFIQAIFFTAGILALMTGTHIIYIENVFQVTNIQNIIFVLVGGIYAITGCALGSIHFLVKSQDNINTLGMRIVVSLPTYILYGLLAGTTYIHIQVITVIA